ncbi:hypothetical protein K491DRAFT_606381, partial [Lophiostoma macrostomum CBS 122681]
PPQYSSLAEEVNDEMRSLAVGDPDEIIAVPMIHSTDKKSLKNMIFREVGKVSQTVIVRKMRRSYYLEHYAKDGNGNYVGTQKPAADAGLVFVPSKSSPEELLAQVHKVAFGKEHYVDARFTTGFAVGGGGL